MKIGTKSVLFGAHQFLIHPLFVAVAWWKLYGFPWDPRLWAAFFVHDLGYIGKPNMDGPEGEEHPKLGAWIMWMLFDDAFAVAKDCRCADLPLRHARLRVCEECTVARTRWHDFTLFHSRFFAKKRGRAHSRLCVADKLAVALEPRWLYLPRVIVTGEIEEYMGVMAGREGSKYNGEPAMTDPKDLAGLSPRIAWHKRMTNYLRQWAYEHKDGRLDTWTPKQTTL